MAVELRAGPRRCNGMMVFFAVTAIGSGLGAEPSSDTSSDSAVEVEENNVNNDDDEDDELALSLS